MRPLLAVLTCALILGAGCSGERDPRSLLGPDGGGTIVVDARLIVGEGFPPIWLGTTVAPDRPYEVASARLRDASVILTTMGGDTVRYSDSGIYPYQPVDYTPGVARVEPLTTYRLHVRAPDGRVVTAETTTPDTFHVREWLLVDDRTLEVRRRLAVPEFPEEVLAYDSVYSSNRLVYQDGLVEARFDRDGSMAFQMALFSLDDNSPLLIDADFLSEADKASLERQSASPPLDAPDGFVRLPWLAVWYEGRHRFVVYSVDRNWYDLARSINFYAPAGLGFGSNAGDEFQRPIFHVNGGIGIFGSAAMDWTGFTVFPRP